MESRVRLAPFPAALLLLLFAPIASPTTLFVNNHVNSNEIQGLASWRGSVAAATTGGIALYDPAENRFQKLIRTPTGLPSNDLFALVESPGGLLWVGTATAGVARLKPDGTFRRSLTSFEGLPGDRVQALYVHGDSIWVGTNSGVALLTEDPASGQVSLRRSDTNLSTAGALAGNDVRAFIQVGDTLWCATTAGLSSFAAGSWTRRTAALSLAGTSFALFGDTLWVATPSGPYRYAAGLFTPATAGHAGGSLSLTIFQGSLYSGSSGSGAYRYGASGWAPLGGAGLPSTQVRALLAGPDGGLWAGTSRGLARRDEAADSWEGRLSDGPLTDVDKANVAQGPDVDARGIWIPTGNATAPGLELGVVLHYDGAAWSALTVGSTQGSLQGASIFGLLSDRAGRLWFGHCCGAGDPKPRVDRWDPGADVWDSPPPTNIRAIAQSPSGGIYAGSYTQGNGVYLLDETTGALLDSLTPANTQGATGPGLASNTILDLAFDAAGKGWIAHESRGLDIWDGRGTPDHADDIWIHVTMPVDDHTTSVAVLGPSAAWIGTTSGAVRYDSGSLRQFDPTTNPALPSAVVTSLAADSHGMIWIGTAAGLARMDASGSGPIETFTTEDGLVDNDVRGLAWDDAARALWVVTGHGISRVVPSSGAGAGFDDQTYVYPNPARQAPLRLGGMDGSVQGEVRDLSGSVVRRFRCDPASPEIWDLRTADGSPASAGVYLIVLHGAGASRVLRAAVIR